MYWYFVQIISICDETVDVLLIDIGIERSFAKSRIFSIDMQRPIVSDSLPLKAMRCRLQTEYDESCGCTELDQNRAFEYALSSSQQATLTVVDYCEEADLYIVRITIGTKDDGTGVLNDYRAKLGRLSSITAVSDEYLV